MKKIILAGLFLLPLGLVASVSLTNENVNTAITEVLSVFQDPNTKIGATFSELKASKTSITKLKLKAWLWRKGDVNTFDLKINNLDYSYKGGKNPALNFDGVLNLDLTKAFGRDELNNLAEDLEESVKVYASEYLEKYGEAAKVSAQIVSSSKNANGDYQSMEAEFKLDLDFSKLPAEVVADQVEFKSARATFAFTPTSVKLNGGIVFNPKYVGFGDDASGLKDELEKLVNYDSRTVNDHQRVLGFVLGYIDEIVSEDNTNN